MSMGFFAAGAMGQGGGGGSGAWTTVSEANIYGINTGWSGYTIRVMLDASAMVPGTKFRLTIDNTGEPIVMSKCFIQTQAASGDPYDFSTTPIQVMFGGSPMISSAGGIFVSDEIALAQDGSAGLVVSAYFSGVTTILGVGAVPNRSYGYVVGDDAATVNASGYTTTDNVAYLLSKIEVWAP